MVFASQRGDRPELRLVTSEDEELSVDALPIHGYENYNVCKLVKVFKGNIYLFMFFCGFALKRVDKVTFLLVFHVVLSPFFTFIFFVH